nr:helix-turn-helix domain-containing protein [Micromonospora sp. DSM 115978]
MDNQKLSPSARLTLDALKAGPGNVHELSERTGRSRSTTDKAINDLAKIGLIVKVDDGGDPADGAPTRWQLAEAAADAETGQPEPDGGDNATEPDTDTPATDTTDADAATRAEAADPAADPEPDTDPPTTGDGDGEGHGTAPDGEATADGEATPDGGGQPDTEAKPDGEATQDGDEKKAEAEPPKLCRGCQTQMPKICQCCWQKTPAYCGKCRKDMPQVRRGEPGEPVILSNGLPKLRPGELEAMVAKVLREQPLPAFAGVTGWTGGRVAIHLPGRSTGAINNALEKLERNKVVELIGDKPMRYKLTATDQQPDGDPEGGRDTNPGTDGAPAQDSQADDAQPPADAEAPQPDATA